MPYEERLEIPKPLWTIGNKIVAPHTLNIWPSIFVGEIKIHPQLQERHGRTVRRSVRKILHKIGIKWHRKGKKFYKDPTDLPILGKVYNSCVKYEETVFSKYSSYLYDIPGVSDGFVLGGSYDWFNEKHRIWKTLVSISDILPYEIVALYTHCPDYQCHLDVDLRPYYFEIFRLAKEFKTSTILLSDHGCCPESGKHTEHAYIGTNFPIKGNSVLDIRKIIEDYFNNSKIST